MHTLTAHPAITVGWILIVAGLILYAGSIAISVFRVRRQFSGALSARRSLATSAAFAAAGSRWPFLAAAIIGVILIRFAH